MAKPGKVNNIALSAIQPKTADDMMMDNDDLMDEIEILKEDLHRANTIINKLVGYNCCMDSKVPW